ncbi:MAG: PAS domain S-box protein [Nitrospirae bacterium]|nr:PAS domain S-box protein [Nitrospirota bacterium]
MDISARKLSEGALVESEKRYRTLAEAAHDMIFIIDSEDKVQYANSFAAQSLGYNPEDIIGTPRETLFPADTTSRQKSFLQKVFKNGAPLYSESETQFKNHKLWLGTMLVPIKDEGGEVNSVLGISRDITATKKIEAAIKESEEKYRMLIENIQDGVFIIQDAKIKFLNEAFAKIIGYTAEELVGIDIQKLIAPEDLDIVMERYQERLAGKDVPKEYEFLMLHKDGATRVIVNMLVGLADYQGRTASMGTVKDVTEHKLMEAELQKAQKLESLGILAGGIAHDFNNILTAITGNISLAKMYAQPGLEVFDILTEAEKASLRAKNLTTQLLTFSKGGIPVKRLSSMPKLIKDSCSFALSGSKIKCEISSPDNLWPVEIDEGQISQVIHHMIINAQQAMPEGGIIKVKAENITADAEHPLPLKGGKYLKISIKDHGIGISEEHLAKIFDPYFTTKQEGSGLGLASAYSIIKKHDGHITAESKLGEGTTFYIYLPASEKKIPIVKDTGISSASRGRGKVLVMDDDDTVRLVVGRMLGQCGYEAEFAEDGDKAIDLYKKAKETGQPFDAVIIDLIIPAGMGGKEAIKKLIEIDPDIRAIVSSGYSDDPVLSNFKEYGFKDAMAKPYEIAELRQILHKVISGI